MSKVTIEVHPDSPAPIPPAGGGSGTFLAGMCAGGLLAVCVHLAASASEKAAKAPAEAPSELGTIRTPLGVEKVTGTLDSHSTGRYRLFVDREGREPFRTCIDFDLDHPLDELRPDGRRSIAIGCGSMQLSKPVPAGLPAPAGPPSPAPASAPPKS